MLLGQEIYHSQNKKNFQKNRYFPRAFEAGQAWNNMGFGTPQESTSSLSTQISHCFFLWAGKL